MAVIVAALLPAAAVVMAHGSGARMSLVGLRNRLDRPVATTILVQGDSTGSAPTRWVHRFTVYLATAHPALTVRYHGWDQQTQTSFMPVETVQRGRGRGTLDVWNASMPGAITGYTLHQHFKQQTAMRHVDALFINYSHNDSTVSDYGPLFTSLAKADQRKYPSAMIVGLTQNPEFAPRPATWVATTTLHAPQVRAACKAHGWELIDTFADFQQAIATGGHTKYIASEDGVHPTPAGDQLWAASVERWFTRAR